MIVRETRLGPLHDLIETQRLVNASASPERIMQIVVQRAQAACSAQGAAIELVQGDFMVTKATSGVLVRSVNDRTALDTTVSGECLRLRIPVVCRDAVSDEQGTTDLAAPRVQSVLVAPLVWAGQGLGVLKVVAPEANHFDDADADVLELMANFAASSLSRAASRPLHEAHDPLRDQLTGLANRVLLMDRLTQVIYGARRYGHPFGIFFIDLDGFKSVNYLLGRDIGNTVLQTVGRCLSATVRTGDTLARLGGDQFVIVCQNADRTAEDRIRARLETVFAEARDQLDIENLHLTASIGAIWSTGEETSTESLITGAMSAMYRSRRQRDTLVG